MNENININFSKRAFSEIEDVLVLKGIDLCYQNKDKAYAPYSNFSVICAVVFEDGSFVLGSNQENIAFPSGICAEANAISSSGSNFSEKKTHTLIIVAFDKDLKEVPFISPCGNCRQIMLEFEYRNKAPISVFFGSKLAGFYKFNSCQDLMPLFFSPKSSELN